MIRTSFRTLLIVQFLLLGTACVTAQEAFTILHPTGSQRTAKVRMAAVVGTVDDDNVSALQLLIPHEDMLWLRVSSKEQKDAFAPAVKNLFPELFYVEKLVVTTIEERKRKEDVKTYTYSLDDAVDLKKFWASEDFKEIFGTVFKKRLFTIKMEFSGKRGLRIDPAAEDGHLGLAGYFVFTPKLHPGENPFVLRALDAAGSVKQQKSFSIFYVNDYTLESPDAEGERRGFHAGAFEENCAGCHDTEVPEEMYGGGESLEDYCAPCHTPLVTQASSHFPASSWDCLTCHDAASTPPYALYGDKDYDTGLCFECHVDVEEAVSSEEGVVHFPATDRCMACHDAHGSADRALLVDRVTTICASCHEDMAQQPHPVNNHPLETVLKPSAEPKELYCTSCHEPHAAPQPKLLPSTRGKLCQNCHNY